MTIAIPDFSKARILVVGDVMLDSYYYGNSSRISPEAPVLVVNVKNVVERGGGAANVALNIAALGGKVKLLGLVGDDPAAERLENNLRDAKIDFYLQRFSGVPTINKLRVIGHSQQLIRLDFEEKFQQKDDERKKFLDAYRASLKDVDLVILSDYGKGTLSMMRDFIKLARDYQKQVLVDPKNKDFSIYKGATLIKPNLKEFEEVTGAVTDEKDLVLKAETMRDKFEFDAVLLTKGAEGMSLFCKGKLPLHLKAHAEEVYDVSGAGDTVIATLGTALASGSNLVDATILANTAASVVVKKLGAASVSLVELRQALDYQIKNSKAQILTLAELLHEIAGARNHGEKIVMTNGCFDILHAGHIAYLEKAKALGQRLIIAVNDNASVARLKGKTRPVNDLEKRMLVLAALRAVDWVISFSEDTPRELIEKIKPDILVKGGDYRVKDIAGADFVLQNGGRVEIIPFVAGFSTSSLIEKINREK